MFSGNLLMFQSLCDRTLPMLERVTIVKEDSDSGGDVNSRIGQSEMISNMYSVVQKLTMCINVQHLSITLKTDDNDEDEQEAHRNAVDSSILPTLLNNLPRLTSLSLDMRLRRSGGHINRSTDADSDDERKHEHLRELTFDISPMIRFDDADVEQQQVKDDNNDESEMHNDELYRLLTRLPSLTSLVSVTPLWTRQFYHVASVIDRTHPNIEHWSATVTDSPDCSIGWSSDQDTTNDYPRSQFFISNVQLQKALRLNICSATSFQKQLKLCLHTKYHCSFLESRDSIDLHPAKILDDDYRESESKRFYEGLALRTIDQLIHSGELCCDSTLLEHMSLSLKQKGLPPCVKALIELHAPAIC